MTGAGWDRSHCVEQMCYCHDDGTTAYACSGCGCRPAMTSYNRLALCDDHRYLGPAPCPDCVLALNEEPARMRISVEAWRAAERAWKVAVLLSRSFTPTHGEVALTWDLLERDWRRDHMLDRRKGDRVK